MTLWSDILRKCVVFFSSLSLPLSFFTLPLPPSIPLFWDWVLQWTHTGLMYLTLALKFPVPVSRPSAGLTNICHHVQEKTRFPVSQFPRIKWFQLIPRLSQILISCVSDLPASSFQTF